MALAAYRALLRQIHATFEGDAKAIREMTVAASKAFKDNRHLKSGSEIQQRIADADEARMFIRESIVQARKSSCGTYAVKSEDAPRLKDMAPGPIGTQS